MEGIKKFLKEYEDYSMIYSDESDSSNEIINGSYNYISDASILKAFNTDMTENNLTCKKRNGKERLPTRRPDPNVYNRNALLARENRRKKKIYLETIEGELRLARKANQVLLKALKHQMKIRRQLEEEKMYFKGLIAERSDHLGLDQASKSPCTSETETTNSFSISNSFKSLHFFNSEDGCEKTNCSSSILGDETASICPDSNSDDFENENSSLQTTSLMWDNTWGNNGTNADHFIEKISSNNVLRDVNNDHCYVTNLKDKEMSDENYQNGGNLDVSNTCLLHTHSDFLEIFSINSECQTPPIQLLEDNL